jgi:phage terminase large subunit
MIEVKIPKVFKPLDEAHRYKVMYGGRGGSKSWGVARALLIEGYQRDIRVLCARETQSSIQDSVHQLLSDQIHALGLDHHYTIKENEIVGTNGTLFKFAGLRQQDVTKIKSFENFSHCWVEEAQAVSDKSWGILIPTIRRPKSEIWVTFNPELDTDPTYERFVINPPSDCQTVFINWRDNPWFPDVLNNERLHLKKSDPIAYENVWEGKCKAAVDGAIYYQEVTNAQVEGRIKAVPYNPDLRVHTIWDLGWNDSTSIILVQKNRSEIAIIDYIEDDHRALDSYVAELKDKKLNWGADYLPHDARAKSLQTGASAEDVVRRLGRDVRIIGQTKVEMGITAARGIFSQCYFDSVKAKRLLQCLKRYRRAINTATDEPGAPLHDEYSHGADAFRYLGLVARTLDNQDTMKPLKYNNDGIV